MKSELCRWLFAFVVSCTALRGTLAQVTQERFAQTIPNVAIWTDESYAVGNPGCSACDCDSGNAQFCYNDTTTDRSWLTATAMQDFSFEPTWQITSVKVDIMCRFRVGTSDKLEWDFQVPGVRGWATAPPAKSFTSADGSCRYRLGNLDISNMLGRPWTRTDLDALQMRVRRGDTDSTRMQVRAFRVIVTAQPTCTANDQCSGAFNAGVGTTYVDNTQSCVDGPPTGCDDPDNPASKDVWHKFIAPETRLYSIQVCSDAFEPMLSVYDGCGGTEFACDTLGGLDCHTYSSTVDIRAQAGHEYMIRVAGIDGGAGASWLNITPGACISVNDLCAEAIEVGVGQTYVDNSCSIDDEAGSRCDTDGISTMDVWYRFIPSRSGRYVIQVCSDDFDTVLSVFIGGCDGNEVDCSDNDYGGCMASSSTVTFDALAGQPYLIRVASVSGDSGGAIMTIADLPPALNDTCEGATAIGQGQTRFNTSSSSLDVPGTTCDDSFFYSIDDLWYSFEAPTGGIYDFAVCTNDFDPSLALYDSCNEQDWACAKGGLSDECLRGAFLSAWAAPGQTILIRVAGSSGLADLDSHGTGILNVVMECPADLDGDGFVNGNDFDLFAWFFEIADPWADMNWDGFVNGDDYDYFAERFEAGC